MHELQNMVARQWTLAINVWADEKRKAPRDLTGYRAICLNSHPPHIICLVDIIRPKTQGTVRALCIDDGDAAKFAEDENIFCEVGLQDMSGKIERLGKFEIKIS